MQYFKQNLNNTKTPIHDEEHYYDLHLNITYNYLAKVSASRFETTEAAIMFNTRLYEHILGGFPK